MPEQVIVNKKLGILEVKSHGVVTREDLSRALEMIEALAKETDIYDVLVDTSEEKELPAILDLDDFGATVPDSLKVAVLVTKNHPTTEKATFIANVAVSKGVHIKTFTSREASLEWLKK